MKHTSTQTQTQVQVHTHSSTPTRMFNPFLKYVLLAWCLCMLPHVSAVDTPTPPTIITAETADTTPTVRLAPTVPGSSTGEGAQESIFNMSIDLGGDRQGTSQAVKLLVILTVLSVAPAFLIMMTSFTRVIIILGFVRRALGTNTLPPNQAILGLALFLTMFIMAPTAQTLYNKAYVPYMAEEISEETAIDIAEDTMRVFLSRHTRRNDLAMFINISGGTRPETIKDVPLTTLIPAFITSELKTAFQMGFILFLPFIIIDLVIAAVLMALGMMMLPPVIISLPFKLLLFVLIDGWALITHSIIMSYA